MTDRYIEHSFPIVQLNPLSQRERNAFKPVYKMHKWFARRSSSIFRAILLGAALPYQDEDGNPIDLMEEFYKPHVDDPRLRNENGEPLKVLDPFMGGGTTVVEALRLGFEVTGNDYNPVAWFIVKGETTPVGVKSLQAAYDRVAAKVREQLLSLYRTRCPLTGDLADIIYGFWVKQGICVDPQCGTTTDLFKNYIVGRIQGDLGLYYIEDATCPKCGCEFDWELQRCTITADGPKVLGEKAAGKARPADKKFSHGLIEQGVSCPNCRKRIRAEDLPFLPKRKKKKILIQALIDPSTSDLFEVRGEIPDEVTAPVSGFTFAPKKGPTAKGKFTCQACGRIQSIVDSAEAYGQPLPFRYYAYYAHTPHGRRGKAASRAAQRLGIDTNNFKWFASAADDDQQKIRNANAELQASSDQIPIPDQEIYDGYNTNRLVIHQYKRWSELYNPRQLLALGLLLRAIAEEPESTLRNALLAPYQITLGCMSKLAMFNILRNTVERINSAHDYRNPTQYAESSVWGLNHGRGSYFRSFIQMLASIDPAKSNFEWREAEGSICKYMMKEDSWFVGKLDDLHCGNASDVAVPDRAVDLVVTDPPYAGSVQYAEMSDWYYVWLHKVLADHYPEFEPEITLKAQEIIEDSMIKDAEWFFGQMTVAWKECHRVLKDDGLLVFTFHHKEGDRWSGLLRSLFDAGFYLVAAYPTHSEALNSIVIQATKGITYDIIHVCRKRLQEPDEIPWSLLRKQVRREAQEQLKELEAGGDVLPGPDVWMILLGKALKLFSQHYGKVIDADGEPIALEDGFDRLSTLLREVRGETAPLPADLQDIDGLSKVYFIHVLGKDGWTRDGLHIELRGYIHSTDDLLEMELVERDPADKARLIPVSALERYERRSGRFSDSQKTPIVDKLHLIVGAEEAGEDATPWLRRWETQWEALVEGLKLLGKHDVDVREGTARLVRLIGTLEPGKDAPGGQTKLF